MNTADQLRDKLKNKAMNPSHVTPTLESLCGIIDGLNKRIDLLEYNIKYGRDSE